MLLRTGISGVLIALYVGLMPRAGVAAAGAITSTEAIGLHKADVPGGFRQVLAMHHSNRTAAGATLTLATLKKNGRLTDYETTYSRVSKVPAYAQIDDVVTAYKGTSGARWGYNYVVSKMKGTHALTLPAVGTASTGFTTTVPVAKSPPEIIDFIVFYHGKYGVSLTIQGPKGTVHKGELVRLARIINGRIH